MVKIFKKTFYETLIVNGKTELSVDAKELKQILNSKKSQELKYEYIGNTKNNLPHTPNGYGEKHFEFIDEVLEEYRRKQVGKRPPITIMDLGVDEPPKPSKPDYDLELLRDYAQNNYTKEFFHFCGQRVIEKAEYKNGKAHGATYLFIARDESLEHHFFCFFKNGVPDGICICYDFSDDNKIIIQFDNGKILIMTTFEEMVDDMELEKAKKILEKFKSNKLLWDCMCNVYLDTYFEDLFN